MPSVSTSVTRQNAEGRLWSEVLQLWLGTWEEAFQERRAIWLRFFDAEGQLVLTRAEAAEQRAVVERQRAEAAEAELARVRARLAELEDET